MVLIVPTGELASETKEFLSELARDEAEDDRRKDVRRLCREKREVMDWKRGVCMMAVVFSCRCGRESWLKSCVC